MTTRRILWSIGLLASLGFGGTAPAHASVIYVATDPPPPVLECFGAPFHTIGAALAVARPGDEIRICPGEYPEQIVLSRPIRLTGVLEGTVRPRIKPAALPVSQSSLLGANAVTAALIVDNELAAIANLEVDLSNVSVSSCLPVLTGIYLRRASGFVERTRIVNVRTSGQAPCNSGVGLYIESGQVGEILGKPVVAQARVTVRDVELAGYQKAGLAANGPRTTVVVRGGSATGTGPIETPAQYGYQIGFGASGRLTGVTTTGHISLRPGKAAADVLGFRGHRLSVSRSTMSASQEGVLAIGDRTRVKRSQLSFMTGDGIVFLGHRNLALGNLIEASGVAGVFANGNINVVRAGVIRDQLLGVWFQEGIRNRIRGIWFDGVPVEAQGVYGGIRWDMTTASAEPFTTECRTAADCDDGNSCTTAVCQAGHCVLTTLAPGSTCDDGNSCTTGDLCNTAGLCAGTTVPPATPCDDGKTCTTGDTCTAAGVCVGTPALAGTPCDDGNGCTGSDVCNGSGSCGGTPLIAGTACDDGNACTLGDACNGLGMCHGAIAPTGTACDDGQVCTTGYCSSGSCLGTPEPPGTVCDDSNPCTTSDVCAPAAVCSGTPVPDGTPCGSMMTCTAGVCS